MNKELNVKVKFFSKKNEGRVLLPENYLGMVFISQDEPLEEKEIKATVSKTYPDINYSTLMPGTTFTIREGTKIVGNGCVL